MTLTTELQHAATALEGHRPQGPCDDDCGCETLSVDDSGRRSVMWSPKPAKAAVETPISCSLTGNSMRRQLDEWNSLLGWTEALRGQVATRVAVDGGVRLEFAPGIDVQELARLVTAEQECCRFFSFNITVNQRGIGLEATAPADGTPLLHALFGAPT